MALFPMIETEDRVQLSDRTRLSAANSFATAGRTITKIEIEPEASAGYFDVTVDKFLDWAYSAASAVPGTETGVTLATISVRLTDDLANTLTKTFNLELIDAVSDKLYATDAKLRQHEPELMRYLPEGRSSFKNVHRRAQGLILAWLDKEGMTDVDGKRLTKANLVDVQEVTEWATFLALSLIFRGMSNAKEDVFSIKAAEYEKMATVNRQRAVLRLDVDNDGQVDPGEQDYIRSATVVRR